jgi:hypothetical protein
VSGDSQASAGATSMELSRSESRPSGSQNENSRVPDPYDSQVRARETTTARAALVSRDRPFKPAQLTRIDEALTLASRETGLLFSLYVGELGPSSRQVAEMMFAKLAARHHAPVLLAISPGERRLEIVTGGDSARRIPNRVAGLAALAMRGSFSSGDLTGGIVGGLRQLADAAGRG